MNFKITIGIIVAVSGTVFYLIKSDEFARRECATKGGVLYHDGCYKVIKEKIK